MNPNLSLTPSYTPTQSQLDANKANFVPSSGGSLSDILQSTTNVLHSLGIQTPELGLTEMTGGVSSNQPVTYRTNTGTTYSVAPGSAGGNFIGPDGNTYNADGTMIVRGSLDGTNLSPSPDVSKISQISQITGYDANGNPIYNTGGVNPLTSYFNDQKANIFGTSTDAANSLKGGYKQSILDTIHNLTTNQQGIDRKNVQNESSRIQGGRDIMSMIGQGIKSGGVMLANKNAGSSSAAQAIANAYAQLGKQQMSTIGNQYSQNAGDIKVAQDEQNYQVGQAPSKFHEQLMQNVNSIVAAARDRFAALDAAMASASMPDRVAIDQEKENVRQQVMDILQGYDAQLSTGVGGIKTADRGTNIATANTQLAAGQADPNLFNYSTTPSAQFQGTGPFASELPIFTYNSKTKQTV